jgi:methionyl-tRNA formyltransferase
MSAAHPTVVFAYSEVGARCLGALFEAGIGVRLVVTHEDDPNETRWFASVAEVARGAGCRAVTPAEPTDPALLAEIEAIHPEFIFSFYYRKMLPAAVLSLASRGALNMHGSLLPKYRGRAPINWAVLHGERETGASLHYMVARPDAGDLVDQQAVPIGPDDTAIEVADRVADAAVTVLRRSLPGLVAGTARATPLDLSQGSYFGGRRPADGEFSFDWPAERIHDLVRAVAPPFPGAYVRLGDAILRVYRTRRLGGGGTAPADGPSVGIEDGAIVATCGDGARLELADVHLEEGRLDAGRFTEFFGHPRVSARPLAAGPT